MALEWTEDYRLNIPNLDADHQQWFSLIEALAAFKNAHQVSPEATQALAAVIQFTKGHFEREESFMRENQYTGYLRHKALHDDFLGNLSQAEASLERSDHRSLRYTVDMLESWVRTHVRMLDKDYAGQVGKGRG